MRQMRTRHIRPLLLRKVGLHTVMGWLWATSFMWNLRDGNWPEKILHQGHLLLQFNIQSWISQQLPVKLKRHVSKLVIGKSLLLRVQNLNKAGHLRPSGHIRPSGILDVNTVANGSMEKSHLSGIAITVLRAHHSTMGDVVLGKKLWYKFRACRPGVEPLQDAQTPYDSSRCPGGRVSVNNKCFLSIVKNRCGAGVRSAVGCTCSETLMAGFGP